MQRLRVNRLQVIYPPLPQAGEKIFTFTDISNWEDVASEKNVQPFVNLLAMLVLFLPMLSLPHAVHVGAWKGREVQELSHTKKKKKKSVTVIKFFFDRSRLE